MGEESLPLEIDLAFIGDDGPFGRTPRPEGVAHGAPGVLQIRAVQSLAILASDEGRGCPRHLHVNDGLLVSHGLDRVARAILGQFNGTVLGIESGLVIAEVDVA